MDQLSVRVSDIPKRSVTFEATQEEAESISRYLQECLVLKQHSGIRTIRSGFAAIAENRNYGGH